MGSLSRFLTTLITSHNSAFDRQIGALGYAVEVGNTFEAGQEEAKAIAVKEALESIGIGAKFRE